MHCAPLADKMIQSAPIHMFCIRAERKLNFQNCEIIISHFLVLVPISTVLSTTGIHKLIISVSLNGKTKGTINDQHTFCWNIQSLNIPQVSWSKIGQATSEMDTHYQQDRDASML